MIVALLNVLKTAFETPPTLPDVDLRGWNVEISEGPFDAGELTRQSFRAPALRIAFLGAARSKAQPNEERAYDCGFAVFIVTDRKTRTPDGVTLAQWVAEQITLWRHHQLRGVGLPNNQRLQALGLIEDKGVAVHAVAWTQPVRIGRDAIDAGVHDPAAIPPSGQWGLEMDIIAADLPEGI